MISFFVLKMRQFSLKLYSFLNSHLHFIAKLLTDLFKLKIIAGVAKWKRHSGSSLQSNWFCCRACELLTVVNTAAEGNHQSTFDRSVF